MQTLQIREPEEEVGDALLEFSNRGLIYREWKCLSLAIPATPGRS